MLFPMTLGTEEDVDVGLNDLLGRTVCSVTFLHHFTGAPRAAGPSKDVCAGFFPQCLVVYSVHLLCLFLFSSVVPFFV